MIKGYHVSGMSTPNNPGVPAGAAVITYAINGVTVTNDIATVNFSITADGTPMTLTTIPPAGYSASNVGFLLAYSLPQDGIAEPADFNNLGRSAAQPISVSLSSVAANLTAGTASGTYDVTLTANPFPAGATMRSVALQGYFTQSVGTASIARHAASVVMAADGDNARREVLNLSGCMDCHESLELHGGSRVIAAENVDGLAVCTLCHNPNLSSGGNTFDMSTYTAGGNANTDATIAMFGNDPMAWPEATQNFKDLVHGIHSASVRETPYEHVRVRSGNAYGFDWSEVTYPNDPSRCSKCHEGNSYFPGNVPAGALMTTDITTNGAIATPADSVAARASVPNDQDVVNNAVVAACYSCHNSGPAMLHMNANQ